MNIKQNETETKGAFVAEIEDKRVGEMTYSKAGTDRIIIDHTEVEEAYKGQKVGLKLVQHAVEYARSEKISIIPLCVFARATFQRHPEWNDVL